MPNFIKIGGGQEHFGLFLVDFIWNDPHGKIQTHTIHISSVIVDQIIANLEHRLTWKVASLFSNLAHVKSVTK